MAGVMGFPTPPAQGGGSFLEKLQRGLLGGGNSYGGLLGDDEKKAAQRQAMMAMAAQLMQAGGQSDRRVGFGEALGSGLMAGQQAQQGAEQQALQAMLLKTKLQKAQAGPKQPSDVQSYEYAKANGYKGTFEDWKRVGAAQPQRPADLAIFDEFQKMTPEQQKTFMSIQRQPTAPQLAVINGVPTLVDRIKGTQTPLTTQAAEIDAAVARTQAESQAKATGAVQGEIAGGIQKKGAGAKIVQDTLDIADPLIDVATGSATGAGYDKLVGWFGGAPDGAKAIASLKILQANLMTNMPRMEGPQSDRDVELYRQAAGSLGEPDVPRDIKKAAVQTIRQLQKKYADSAAAATESPPATGAPVNVGQTTTINGVKVKRVK